MLIAHRQRYVLAVGMDPMATILQVSILLFTTSFHGNSQSENLLGFNHFRIVGFFAAAKLRKAGKSETLSRRCWQKH